MPNFEQSNPGADVLASYGKATSFSPISGTKKAQVLKDYGIKVGWAKGKSDPHISDRAARTVIKKFKNDQKVAARKAYKHPRLGIDNRYHPAGKEPKVLKPELINRVLVGSGLAKATPPKHALVSLDALYAWIKSMSTLNAG